MVRPGSGKGAAMPVGKSAATNEQAGDFSQEGGCLSTVFEDLIGEEIEY